MLRLPRIVAVLALAVLAPPMIDAAIGDNIARAEEEGALAVGTELMATADVTLHKAEIMRGSKVSVTKLYVHDGKLDGVNVALADGHVVKMPLAAVRSYFRVVND